MAKKKIKKFLKKALPIAALGLGAMGLARRRATDAPGNAMARAKRLMTSDRAYTGGGYDDHIRRAAKLTSPVDEGIWGSPWGAKGGGRAMKSKGGLDTGAAKRGFGRALMKGKK